MWLRRNQLMWIPKRFEEQVDTGAPKVANVLTKAVGLPVRLVQHHLFQSFAEDGTTVIFCYVREQLGIADDLNWIAICCGNFELVHLEEGGKRFEGSQSRSSPCSDPLHDVVVPSHAVKPVHLTCRFAQCCRTI